MHRDLKPANVLIAADGPRVLDFGISKDVDADRVTRTGAGIGTPGFTAPEQIALSSHAGPAADVFSLGCVLAYSAAGHHPFGGSDSRGVDYRVVYEQPTLDAVPEGLRGLVAACLEKRPARRPTVDEVLATLSPVDAESLLTPALLQDLAKRQQAAEQAMTAAPDPTLLPGLLLLPMPADYAPLLTSRSQVPAYNARHRRRNRRSGDRDWPRLLDFGP